MKILEIHAAIQNCSEKLGKHLHLHYKTKTTVGGYLLSTQNCPEKLGQHLHLHLELNAIDGYVLSSQSCPE